MIPYPSVFFSGEAPSLIPIIVTMRALCVLLCLLMMIAFYLSPSWAFRPLSFVPANMTPRQPLGRKLVVNERSLLSELDSAPGNLKKEGDGKMERAGDMGDIPAGEVVGNNGAIYDVDYHGVMTHPSPRPRHPQP